MQSEAPKQAICLQQADRSGKKLLQKTTQINPSFDKLQQEPRKQKNDDGAFTNEIGYKRLRLTKSMHKMYQ